MDYYVSEENCYLRLREEFKKYKKLIFCVDFDDTIYDFHKVGRTYTNVIDLLKRWEPYSDVIIFTNNDDSKHQDIKNYLKSKKIKYIGINCDSNISFGGRKPYANVYIDDRGGLPSVYRILKRLIDEIENGEISYV